MKITLLLIGVYFEKCSMTSCLVIVFSINKKIKIAPRLDHLISPLDTDA